MSRGDSSVSARRARIGVDVLSPGLSRRALYCIRLSFVRRLLSRSRRDWQPYSRMLLIRDLYKRKRVVGCVPQNVNLRALKIFNDLLHLLIILLR